MELLRVIFRVTRCRRTLSMFPGAAARSCLSAIPDFTVCREVILRNYRELSQPMEPRISPPPAWDAISARNTRINPLSGSRSFLWTEKRASFPKIIFAPGEGRTGNKVKRWLPDVFIILSYCFLLNKMALLA